MSALFKRVGAVVIALDPDGWDYYCTGSDGSSGLYALSADGVAKQSPLASYH